MNVVIAHPRLVTLGIGLVVTFVVGTAIGMLDHQQAFAVLRVKPVEGCFEHAFMRLYQAG
jgi:hypothetical protein